MRYGFVGLGNLGGHLAANLLRAGLAVRVHDRDLSRAERHRALGGEVAGSVAEAAAGADALITCLPSPAATGAVLDGALPAMAEGAHWIEMSTLGRDDLLALAGRAEAAGIACLEAPVTGGVHLAAEGRITVLAGGPEALVAAHRPAFEAMGNRLFHMGPLGSASVIKVITNMLAFINLVGCGEALMLAQRGGLDLGQAWAAIAASSGTSFVHETEGQLILNGSYDIAFTMDLALKDLGFAQEFARRFGVPMALADTVRGIFEQGREAYGGQAQSTGIVRLLEDALATDLRAPGFPERLS